jgi:aryl-alcohol dehydrogenase-like predicted oxidoreductase
MTTTKRLIMGGAQIGQQYGVVRPTSFADGGSVQQLLDLAQVAGFGAIDTARSYGESERLIGSHSWGGLIHTKLDEHDAPETSLRASLDALRREQVELLYVCHDASRVADSSYGRWRKHFQNLRGSSRTFGAAIYADQLDFPLLEFDEIQAIQIPFNVLSPEMIRDRVSEWRLSGKTVNARSIFAQGLLVESSTRNLSPEFVRPIRALHSVSRNLEISPAELAFRWILSYPEIDGVVLGIAQLEEVDAVSSWLDKGPMPEDEFSFVESELESLRHDIDLRKI